MIKLFRIDPKTLDCLLLGTYPDESFVYGDYVVEAGSEYIYCIGVLDANNHVTSMQLADNMTVQRLMRMDSSYLLNAERQLRLTGNVQVSQFKRTVSEQLQTTLGAQYPYYSRSSKNNYRVLSLSAVITINFDPTGSFLNFTDDYDLIWKTADGVELIADSTDIFGHDQISLSRRRIKDPDTMEDSIGIIRNLVNAENRRIVGIEPDHISGPLSIYSSQLHRNLIKNYTTDRTDEMVFLERRFREKVMSWLADGKPKLFKSETEGNMIVVPTGVTFTPLENSHRMVYSLQCTLTEIAEYNTENLRKYGLIPNQIKPSNIPDGTDTSFVPGDRDSGLSAEMSFRVDLEYDILYGYVGELVAKIVANFDSLLNADAPVTFTVEAVGAESPNYNVISGGNEVGVVPKAGQRFDADSYSYRIIATDADGDTAERVIVLGPVYDLPMATNIFIPLYEEKVAITAIDVLDTFTGGAGIRSVAVTNLPSGLSFNPATNTVTGAFTSAHAATSAHVTVIDIYDKSVVYQINFAGAYGALHFAHSPDFDIPRSEVGFAILPISVLSGVSGGNPNPIVNPPNGYRFSTDEGTDIADPPCGIVIDPATGILSGTPLRALPAGNFNLHVTDGLDTRSIIVNYAEILARLTFVDEAKNDLPQLMIDTTFIPADPTDYMLMPQVSGGAPFATPPVYRFSATGLDPNYVISVDGVISGYGHAAQGAKDATIYVEDSRGRREDITIRVGPVTGSIIFPDSDTYDIPNTRVGDAITTIVIALDPALHISGGLAPFSFSAPDLINGLTIATKIDNSGGAPVYYAEISGRPTAVRAAQDISVIVQDSSAVPQQGAISIRHGATANTLAWMDSSGMDIPVQNISSALTPIPITGITGGIAPYTFTHTLPTGYTITAPTLASASITGTSGDTPVLVARTAVLTVHDASGQSAAISINVGKWIEPLVITFIDANWGDYGLLQNVSIVAEGGHTGTEPLRIANASGGVGAPYTFGYTSGAELVPGIVFNNDGTIEGTPTMPTVDRPGEGIDIGTEIWVRDADGNESFGTTEWLSPNVLPRYPVRADGKAWDEPMLRGPLVFGADIAEFVIFSESEDYGARTTSMSPCEDYNPNYNSDTNVLSWNGTNVNRSPQNTPYIGEIGWYYNWGSIRSIYSPTTLIRIPVQWEYIAPALTYTPDPADLKIPAMSVNVPITPLDVSQGAAGGILPYTFAITAGTLPEGITLDPATGILSGTPTTEVAANEITITVTDSYETPNEASIVLNFEGTFDAIVIPDLPAWDIPTGIVDEPLDPTITITGATGGRGEYAFRAENLEPYVISSTGTISGTPTAAQSAKVATIIVYDPLYPSIQSSIQINVGEIESGNLFPALNLYPSTTLYPKVYTP